MAKASTVLFNAARALTDERDHRRWPLAELLDYLNDGVLELLEKRPDAFAQTQTHACAVGTRQDMTGVHAILRVMRNTSGGAVRAVSLAHLDNFNPDWHSDTATAVVKNYAVDGAIKSRFWVHPPNDGTGSLQVDVAVFPTAIAIAGGADPLLLASYDVDIPTEGQFAPALTYYVLHRAWAKDADFAANQAMSNRYYDLFLAAIGVSKE